MILKWSFTYLLEKAIEKIKLKYIANYFHTEQTFFDFLNVFCFKNRFILVYRLYHFIIVYY